MSEQARTGAVHIIEDDQAVRQSLEQLLRAMGYATTSHESAEAFLAALAGLPPGCAVIDIRMPGMDGLELQREMQRREAHMPVVIMTGHGSIPLAVRAMKAGAVDFIEKPFTFEDMQRAVENALATRDRDSHDADAARRVATLSHREREVLSGMLDGVPNKVMARQHGISPRTVEVHRAHLMSKLGAGSLAEVLRIAISAGVTGDQHTIPGKSLN